jgi:hypothetical protein
MSSRRLLACLLISSGLCACDPEPADVPDGGADTGPTCVPSAFEIGSIEGHIDPLGAAVGEVRAGRLRAAELPPDPAGLATWAEGDYVLANDRFAVVVSQPGHFENYDPYGGRVRGLAQIRDGALMQPADFNVAILGLGRFVVATEAVTVLADGSDGAAILRVSGLLVGVEALADLLEAIFPGDLSGLPVALDYVLAPGSDRIDVRVSIRSAGTSARARIGTAGFFQGFRMPAWTEGNGFDSASGPQRFVAFEDDDATSYAWLAPVEDDGSPGTVSPLLSMGGFDFYTSDGAVVPPCSEATIALGSLVVGEGVGLPGVQRVLARILESPSRGLQVTLSSSDAGSIDEARVHVLDVSGERELTRTRAPHALSFEVDADAASIWVWREGAPAQGPISIPASGIVNVDLAPLGTVEVLVTDADSLDTLPARVQLIPVGAAPSEPPALFGERTLGRGRARLEFTGADGRAVLRAAPGTYRLVVSRGWEMERHDEMITLVAGETTSVSAVLVRAFETPGMLCADYHIHTHRSVDSADSALYKVSALVADGLEIAIRSEHEWVSDFAPVVEGLGLSDFAIGLAGEELTTFTYGHFGVFPLVPDPSRPSGGAVTWYDRFAPDVFDEVRERAEAPLLIINHPRAGGVRQGYFRETGFDPVTGTVTHPENWDESFDVVEVINSGDFEGTRDSEAQDWFSLLRSGRDVMMVGSSDSHSVTSDPVGYPRTCLTLGVETPRETTPAMIRDATRRGASFVTGGIYLEVSGPGGIGPGESASGVGGRVSIDVVVRAASFIDVDRLEVIVDGETTELIPILPTDADPADPAIRLRASVEVDVGPSRSFVVLHASGSDEPDIAYGGRPFAVTNPIFLSR